jgi:hypothetical protein
MDHSTYLPLDYSTDLIFKIRAMETEGGDRYINFSSEISFKSGELLGHA